ncbi:MAG: YvcK family protein, partial [Anaerolineaceae bacterium]|nr:YvcK family protein [Anaerolineaceae bacterium]
MDYSKIIRKAQNRIRWLAPGLGVKRWIFMILAGTTLVGLGFAILLSEIYRSASQVWWIDVLTFFSLYFLPRSLRAVIFGGGGLALILSGTWGLNQALLKPFMQPGSNILDTVSAYRKRERGPRIVVMGGGTGLSTMLRGLKTYSNNITAIVSVADDGGSSGELRRSMGILPPGDIRSCLTAMADDENLMGALFQYRFASGNGLSGHSLGNLLITALADITGSFEEGVAESGRVLAVRGKVLPATLHD